ncbi:MAG: GNAT family N-acetyltransferase [Candidatus Omnitrophica bacterium]|nr:GNAT family N-acetyltransferase [Candidatus Omnitrophota bacterium]
MPRQDLAKFLSSPDCRILLVRDSFNTIQAFAIYSGTEHGWGYLKYMAVDPVLKKQGLGSAILSKVIEDFRLLGFVGIKMKAASSTNAAGFYRRYCGIFEASSISEKYKDQGPMLDQDNPDGVWEKAPYTPKHSRLKPKEAIQKIAGNNFNRIWNMLKANRHVPREQGFTFYKGSSSSGFFGASDPDKLLFPEFHELIRKRALSFFRSFKVGEEIDRYPFLDEIIDGNVDVLKEFDFIEVSESENRYQQDLPIKFKKVSEIMDGAQIADLSPTGQKHLGGIDLTLANNVLQTNNGGQEIKFYLNPAMLKQLQNAPGFEPVIISVQPMTNLRAFLLNS